VLRNRNEIVIGTDSKRLLVAKEDLSDAQSELACKIVQADNIFVASAGVEGIVSYKQRGQAQVATDLTEIMKKAALGEGSFADKADALSKAARDALLRIGEWSKNKMPDFYEKMFRGRELLQVVMAGLENETPAIIVMAFESSISPSGELNINVESRPCPGTACPSGFVYILLGEHNDIDRYLPTDPELLKKDPVDVIRKLIEVEVTSEPLTVGPPVDILRITKGGAEWIQEKNTCVDPSLSK